MSDKFYVIELGKPYTFNLRMSGMCQMTIYGDRWGQSYLSIDNPQPSFECY